MSDLVRNSRSEREAADSPAADANAEPSENARKRSAEEDRLDSERLQALFERHQNELLGTLFYLVGNLEDARDGVQECFLKCWRHRHKVGELQNAKAWIFRIAMNTGRDLRGTAWRRKKQELHEENSLPGRQGDQPDAIAHDGEQMERLRIAIADLRPEEKEVFLLRQNGDLTYDEIAEALDIPTGTVKTRMRLAVNKLRKQLREEP